MKKDYNKEDPEKLIFRTALNSIEMQPSEKFWSAAFDNIIIKENAKNIRRVKLWKGVSFILGSIIVLFCLREMVVNNKLDKIDKIEAQLTDIRATQSKLLQNENNSIALKNTPVDQRSQPGSSSLLSSVYNETKNQPGNSPSSTVNSNGNPLSHYNSLITSDSSSYLDKTSPATEPGSIAQTINRETNSINTQNVSTPTIESAKDTTPSNFITNNIDSASAKKNNVTSGISLKQAVVDSTSPNAMTQNTKPAISNKHRFSLSAFFAPGQTSDFLNDRDNDTSGKLLINDVKARQSDLVAYELGAKVGYDISTKFTLSSGLYYNIYSYNIKQTVIYAQQQENGVNYSLVTSSGVVNIPYNGATPKPGDSIKVHGSSSRGYLCIPLQLSYTFAAFKRFKFYAIGGISVNIVAYQVTSLDWQNTSLEAGYANVQSIQGLDQINYSYNLGLGASYTLGKGFSVYVQPSMQGTITPIDKNDPITTYPYFFSFAFGLTYHL